MYTGSEVRLLLRVFVLQKDLCLTSKEACVGIFSSGHGSGRVVLADIVLYVHTREGFGENGRKQNTPRVEKITYMCADGLETIEFFLVKAYRLVFYVHTCS